MAIVVVMQWPEVTRDQYEAVRKDIDWVANPPEGGLMHVAGFGETGFRVVDLWSSPEHFQKFVDAKLTPSVAKIGVKSQPEVAVFPADYVDVLAFSH